MADIAEIGFRADTSELDRAQSSIEALVPPAKEAENASKKLGGAFDKVASAANKLEAVAAGLGGVVDRLSAALSNESNAATQAAVATTKVGNSAEQAGAKVNNFTRNLGNFSGHVVAYRKNLDDIAKAQARANNLGDFGSHVDMYRKRQEELGKTLKQNAQFGLGLGRQLADIGVTGFAGMNPLMIAIQQGPQLLDLFQVKAMQTGKTVKAVALEAAASIWAAVAPFLPLIIAIGAAVAVVASGFALAARSMNKDSEKVTAGLGLTEKQLDRLEKKGVETTITMGDAFKGFFVTVGDYLKAGFAGPLKWLATATTATLDLVTKAFNFSIKFILGTWAGAFRAIVAVWKQLPSVFGDISIQAANAFLSGVQIMSNAAIDVLNKLGANIERIDIPKLANPFEGQAAGAFKTGVDAFVSGYNDMGKAVDKFYNDWEKNSRKIAQKRIKDAAGAPGATKKVKDAGFDPNFAPLKVDSDFENAFEAPNKAWAKAAKVRDEYFKDAAARTTALKQEYAYIGMSADAVTRLRIENDLLAQAKDKEIMLTPEVVAGIKNTAAAQAELEIATRKAGEALDFTRDATRGFLGDMLSGLQQGQSVWKAFGNAVLNVLNKITDKLLDMAVNNLFSGGNAGGGSGIFGAISSGVGKLFSLGGSAKGNVFGRSGIQAYAKGGAFTNNIVTSPTAFVSKGGMGVMGEAGDEAIVPLTRGPDGSLGVQMYGGRGGGTNVNAPVSVNNNFYLSGVVSSADVVALTRAAAEQSKADIKRSIVPWLDQYGRDGTIVE